MHSKKNPFPATKYVTTPKIQKWSKQRKEKENKIIETKRKFSIHM